jgi:ParB/RepB/Spo0J family partition protein
MSSVTIAPQDLAPSRVSLDLIDVGVNVRDLDQEHVDTLAASIGLRGLIVPLVVRPNGERFALVAGHHRLAACRALGISDVAVTLRDEDGASADTAAENVVRKQLSPLEEAHAVKHMLDEGYTLDGAATVLGWNRKLVSARAKILELPTATQELIGGGELPLSAVPTLLAIAEVSSELCELAVAPIAAGDLRGEQFVSNPAWAIAHALRQTDSKVFAAHLATLNAHDIADLRLGKKTDRAYAEAEALHRQIDRQAYGPPSVRFTEQDIDQARAAGVLIEFEYGTPIITDRSVYRELAKQAIARTVEDLRAGKQNQAQERASRLAHGKQERTPQQSLDADHRAVLRDLTVTAHGTNLDLGAALLQSLAAVDPADMDVARFFAYGVLGPEERGFSGGGQDVVNTIAANGIRLVIAEHRTALTPTLKSGEPGRTKVSYGDVEDASTWLWKFIDGAKDAGELYGRVLVVFAAQAYACDLVLPSAARRGPVLPRSRKDISRRAFERLTKSVLPASHVELRRALDREARAYAKRQAALGAPAEHAGHGVDAHEAASED